MHERNSHAGAIVVALGLVLLAGCGGGASSNTGSPPTDTASDESHEDHEHHAAAVPATPLATTSDGLIDPTKIDLGGIAGVSAEQQQRAEELLRGTVEHLPRWSDYRVAEAEGFDSIGDGIIGEEHFVHWDWINDEHLLDPEFPESLMYKTAPDGSKTLEAAMYILPLEDYTLETAPDIGGALTQWHIHNNICFAKGYPPRAAGLTDETGTCAPILIQILPNPMIHVWIIPNSCGPFAALVGVGEGVVRAGDETLCNEAHGHSHGDAGAEGDV